MTFDPTKPVRTRDGRPARIICNDAKNGERIILALVTEREGEKVSFHGINGQIYACEQCQNDLVNIPTKKTGWITLYRGGCSGVTTPAIVIYESKREALKERVPYTHYIACIQIEWEE